MSVYIDVPTWYSTGHGLAESLHQQDKKLKPSSIDKLLYAEPTKLL